MKILVLSDTHGYLKNAENVIAHIGERMEAVIHLGDHDRDAEILMKKFSKLPFYYVKGNNDGASDTPYEMVVSFRGKKFLLTHGHRQQVYWDYTKLTYFAMEQEVDCALFGHTHMPVYDIGSPVILLNPGSISLPRNTNTPTFGILDISDTGIIRGSIMAYAGKDQFLLLDHLPY